ncbi:4,5-DOPA dioxygenase extradiol [Bdellovibrio sp. HCB337]|uniref:4,5-DOPA-extradiol-dioxygenase n=1 Tax=Bdellovibrio sp. HCB337 TaxID=3394358 RepID=UPI0039A74714
MTNTNVLTRMPVLFVGHGSPMNAIEKTVFGDQLSVLGSQLSRPKAILMISAHWQTAGTHVVTADPPKTIHDFYGFPEKLFKTEYPAAGAPELAKRIVELAPEVKPTKSWGLDHGAWSVLLHLFPKADIPVLQLSLNEHFTPIEHYSFAQKLKVLRDEGVLIIGSGNIVHNLRAVKWHGGDEPYPWAQSFDEGIKNALVERDFEKVIDYKAHFGDEAIMSAPTPEHYLPLLYTFGVSDKADRLSFPVEGFQMAAISMRTALWA